MMTIPPFLIVKSPVPGHFAQQNANVQLYLTCYDYPMEQIAFINNRYANGFFAGADSL
ncbi:hypothetical protein SCTVLC_2637 [Serratia symbiotica SCt-VLC]|uniref:Uncharacterized protein n=1 Tax=Serratia symbiotica SCt-VLC TaxID=1347341 RepID=A0A068RDC7_9GAMM|nr:hypothetical protein SCTVLC_2637 [Serratia symbiotica SCt-VLC]